MVLAVLYICSGVRALPRGQKRGFASAKHVIIFGCDGLGNASTCIAIAVLCMWISNFFGHVSQENMEYFTRSSPLYKQNLQQT